MIVSARVNAALAQNSQQVRSASEVAAILGVSKGTLTKAVKAIPGLKAKGGQINMAKLAKLIRKNPKLAKLISGNSVSDNSSGKKSRGKKKAKK